MAPSLHVTVAMRSLLLPSLAIAALTSAAHADERVTPRAPIAPNAGSNAATPSAQKAVSATEPAPRLAIAVNSPFGWIGGNSLGASVYAGITSHVAIRANVASYAGGPSVLGEVISAAAGGDGDEAEHSGRVLDLGVGVVHYSRGLWDGFTLEAGALRRGRDLVVVDDFAPAYRTSTDTVTYAGRALIGWSWLIHQRAFIAVAIGASAGIETGTETTENERGEMKKSQSVDRSDVSLESYLRFGGAF